MIDDLDRARTPHTYIPVLADGTTRIPRLSMLNSSTQCRFRVSPKGSSPTAVRSNGDVPSLAMASAMFLATPPKLVFVWPGFDVYLCLNESSAIALCEHDSHERRLRTFSSHHSLFP